MKTIDCKHEWKKTIDKSGMCFINMCHKCYSQEPYQSPRQEREMDFYNIPGIKLIKELPSGYDYSFVSNNGQIALFGINPEKESICFLLENNGIKQVLFD